MGLTAPNCKVFAESGCTMKVKILKDVRVAEIKTKKPKNSRLLIVIFQRAYKIQSCVSKSI